MMGRLFGLIAVLCAVSAHAKITITKEGNLTRYDVTVDRVSFTQVELAGANFLRPTLEGIAGYEGIRYVVGKPELPVIRFFVDGETDIEVRANPEDTEVLPSRVLWKPALASVEKRPGRRPVVWLDSWSYGASEPEPAATFEIETVGTIRGVPRKLVTLHPVRYYPTDGQYGLISRFRVQVAKRTSSSAWVSAPEDAIAFLVGKAWADHPAIARLEAHKRALGFKVSKVLIDGDSPEMARQKLRAVYRNPEHALRFAILIGDHADVPAYATPLLSGATDHYYRCLDTDAYDTDIGTPDIGVGRLSPSTPAELDIIVDNLVRYEAGRFTDRKWLQWYSFIASDDSHYWPIAEGSLDYAINLYTGKLGLLGNFPSAVIPGGDKLYAVTHKAERAQVLEQLQQGRGFINYGGHGGVDYWVAPNFTPEDVRTLSHPEANPVVISNACDTGKFIDNSFAEIWQRHKSGSVFFWASMDSSYWDEDDILQRAMYDVMYRDKKLVLADITDLSMQEVWRYYGGAGRSRYYWETYNSFGDPSMRFRTGIPARQLP